jgi:hypothetical protein
VTSAIASLFGVQIDGLAPLTNFLDLPCFKIALREYLTIHFHEDLFEDLGARPGRQDRAQHSRI